MGIFRNGPGNRPAHNDLRMDRPAGAQGMGGHRGGNLRDLWRNSCHGRQSRPAPWDFPIILDGSGARKPASPSSAFPAARFNPTTSWRRCSTCLMAAGRAPMIPLDEALRPTWLFGSTVHEGCDRGGYYEQAQFAEEYGSPLCIVKLGCWGPVVQCNVGKRGWMGGIGGCPNVGGICIGCTMPGFPDKFMPFMNQPPGLPVIFRRRSNLWTRHPRVAPVHPGVAQQGAKLAKAAW